MTVALSGNANVRPRWAVVVALIIADLILSRPISQSVDLPGQSFLEELLHRLAMSLMMWRISYMIVMRYNRIADWIRQIEPAIFVIFCSHKLTFMVFGGVALAVDMHVTDAVYPPFFFLQIFGALAVGILLYRLLQPFPLLTGGKRRSGRLRL